MSSFEITRPKNIAEAIAEASMSLDDLEEQLNPWSWHQTKQRKIRREIVILHLYYDYLLAIEDRVEK